MSRRPIEADFEAGPHPEETGEGVGSRDFKDALAHWASTVTVVAVRVDGGSHILGTTVTSFAPVAAEPPLVVVSLGASAQVVPELKEGTEYVVNLLAEGQKRIASVYADSFPVGPSPFPEEGPPVVEGALVSLVCRVESIHPVQSGARLVLGQVMRVVQGTGEAPLLYHQRTYKGLEED